LTLFWGVQGLQGPNDMIDLMDLYEFCGHPVGGLDHLAEKLLEFKPEMQTDCKALRMVLAAAKEKAGEDSAQVCATGAR
jgi:hypothetical protein